MKSGDGSFGHSQGRLCVTTGDACNTKSLYQKNIIIVEEFASSLCSSQVKVNPGS
jgi:hypothetical protein